MSELELYLLEACMHMSVFACMSSMSFTRITSGSTSGLMGPLKGGQVHVGFLKSPL